MACGLENYAEINQSIHNILAIVVNKMQDFKSMINIDIRSPF